MEQVEFELTYGTDKRTFSIPRERLNGPLLAPRQPPVLPGTVREILDRALAEPVERPPLRQMVKGRQVGVVISDEFRAGLQRQILEALVAEVAAGDPHSITVLCATGTHDPGVYAKNAAGWVEQLARQHDRPIEFVANDSTGGEHAGIGATRRGTPLRISRHLLDCDVRVFGHEAKHHYFYGYSCLDKQLLPGLSADETVRANHKLALEPGSGPGRSPYHADPGRRDNPVSEDGREARRLSELFVLSPSGKAVRGDVQTFALDMVSQGQQVYWARAGDPELLSREMVGVVDELMAYRVPRSRYVVLSPGGPPASQALYGTQNSFDLALRNAIEPGGEALVVAPLDGRPDLDPDTRGLAPSARAKRLFWDNLVRLVQLPLEQARRQIADNFEMYLWKTDRVLRLLRGDNLAIYLYCQLDEQRLAPGGFRKAPDIQAWIDERVARRDGLFTVIDQGNKLCVTPAAG